MKTSTEAYAEIWYVIEYSRMGEDDWYAHDGHMYDTQAAAVRATAEFVSAEEFEYRICKRTVTTEPVYWLQGVPK